jgi:hypothetical protein
MEPCGNAVNALFDSSGKQKTWKIQFDSVVEGTYLTHWSWCLASVLTLFAAAEMALSTLQGSQIDATHGLQNPSIMELSATEKPRARKPDVHPILVPSIPGLSSGPHGRQHRYKEFRTFGPLVSVQTGVDVSSKEKGDLLQFWDEQGADAAIKYINRLGDKSWVKVINTKCLMITVCDCFKIMLDLLTETQGFPPSTTIDELLELVNKVQLVCRSEEHLLISLCLSVVMLLGESA